MILYQYPTCSTCRKAKKFLKEKGFVFEEKHIVEETPNKEELSQFIKQSQLPIQKWFNTSGQVYRELQLKDKLKHMDDAEKIDLLAQNGKLIKRPILITKNQVLVGFVQQDYENLFQD